jgi:hypothetical protein
VEENEALTDAVLVSEGVADREADWEALTDAVLVSDGVADREAD